MKDRLTTLCDLSKREYSGAIANSRPPDSENAAAARESAIEESQRLWSTNAEADALDVLRKVRLEFGASARLQYEYGKRAYQKGYFWAAREALYDAIELEPSHLDALELFLETNRLTPGAQGSATKAVTAVAALLPVGTDFDVEAASLLIPSMRDVEIVDQRVRLLRYSRDPVAKYLGYLSVLPKESWEEVVSRGADKAIKAQLIVTLARLDYADALQILSKAPASAKPARSLRVAIRRELRHKNFYEARALLKHYVEIEPADQWAARQLKRIGNRGKHISDALLRESGFPFPGKSKSPVYKPSPKSSLYLLHNSLPWHATGYATRTHGLLRAVRENGWNVQAVTRLGYPYDMPNTDLSGPIHSVDVIDNVPYHRLSTGETEIPKAPLQSYVQRYSESLRAFAIKTKPAVIHAASNHWNGLAAVSTARRLGIPSVYEVRGLWEITRGSRNPSWMYGNKYRFMAQMETDAAVNADHVITITHALRRTLIHRGVDEHKISVMPNGVDTRRFVPREPNMELVRRLGVENKTVVGYVGSILNYEGIDLIIDAARCLTKERDDVAFLLVGDGAELKEYREKVEREKLTDVVIFAGRVPHRQVEDYYSIIDICPFPRLPLPVCEIVSPLKPFEAMAMGKAVVTSDVAALAEIVDHGVTGLLFEKGNIDSFISALRVLLDQPQFRRALSERGRDWVRKERDWKQISQTIDEIYESLLV